ncbi:Tetratricopeptide-like helical domain [Trinorchestia longiramus]|nr:Tetratricopeptide-like helical domain [Trinorchestia longiramus]
MANPEVDELFEVKNSLYIGNYQHCINEAQRAKPRDDVVRAERDAFLYRALLGQRKYGVVQSQIKANAPPSLQAIKLLARFLQDRQQESSVVAELETLVGGSSLDPGSVIIAIAAATVYCHTGNYEAALRILNQHDTLECRAEMVHCYLAMHRLDSARKELKTMQEKDDDATLTQLAQAWIHVASVCLLHTSVHAFLGN